MKGIAKEFLGMYEKIARTVQPAGKGQIFKTNDPKIHSLLLEYSGKTLENLALKHSFAKLFQIKHDEKSISVCEPIPISFELPTDLKARSISPSGKFELRVRKPNINNKEPILFEIWKNGILLKTKDFTKQIKFLYNDHMFGSISWSQDENYCAFIGEAADKNYPGILEDVAENNGKSVAEKKEEKKEEIDPLEKYVYKEDFGEQMGEKVNPKLFIFDLNEYKLEEILQNNTEYWPGTPLFIQENQILFHGYNKTAFKYGLIYCFNRPSALYLLPNFKDKASIPQKLTSEYTVLAPNLSPDKQKVAYLAVEKEFVEHHRCLELRILEDSLKKTRVIIPTIYEPKNEGDFPGIYGFHNIFTQNCFGFLGDNKHILISSEIYSHMKVFIVNIETGKMTQLKNNEYEADEQNVLSFSENLIILKQSSINIPPYNIAIKLDFENAKNDTETLVKTAKWTKFGMSELDKNTTELMQKVEKQRIVTKNSEGYLFYADGKKGKRPLICVIHGGPHSEFTIGWLNSFALYLQAGYSILGINYRGSAGYGQKYIESLLGHAGDYDVLDCIECIDAACEKHNEIIDQNNISITGGSHGGFLAAWLISKYPKKFKAAVIRNPVLDIPVMCGASDIPEWSFAEVLNEKYYWPPKGEDRKKFWKQSPMSEVSKIETPVLLMLGFKDRRVPMLNAIPWYSSIKEKGVPIKLLQFPNDCHPLGEPETEVHSIISGISWIDEHKSK